MKWISRGNLKTVEQEQVNETLQDLIEIIRFAEKVATKIHGVLNETEIYKIIKEEFEESKRYNSTILLLTDGGTNLRIAETSIPLAKLGIIEKASGLRLKEHKIDLANRACSVRLYGRGTLSKQA